MTITKLDHTGDLQVIAKLAEGDDSPNFLCKCNGDEVYIGHISRRVFNDAPQELWPNMPDGSTLHVTLVGSGLIAVQDLDELYLIGE